MLWTDSAKNKLSGSEISECPHFRSSSSAARNMRLTATAGTATANFDFTVFYVTVQAITTGSINDSLPAAVTTHQTVQLRDVMTAFTLNHQQLGAQFFDDTDNRPVSYGAVVFRGQVSPAGMASGDFNGTHSRANSFNWDRRLWSRGYRNDAMLYEPDLAQIFQNADDSSDDSNDLDEDLTPANDLGGNQLYVWVVDVPSIRSNQANFQDGDTLRIRKNFTEQLFYGGVPVSQAISWNWRTSAINPVGARTFVRDNTHNGDNQMVAANSVRRSRLPEHLRLGLCTDSSVVRIVVCGAVNRRGLA